MNNCIKRPSGIEGKKADLLFNQWVKENNIKKRLDRHRTWFYVFRWIRKQYDRWNNKTYRTSKNSPYGQIIINDNDHPFDDDHGSLWEKRDGSRIYTYHSYNFVEEKNKEELLRWAEKYNLTVLLQGREKSWYYPGSTYMISLITKY